MEKVKEVTKYEIKSYEVTMLVQITKNYDKLDLMKEEKLKSIFQTLLLSLFDDPKPFRIKSILINQEIFPYQVEMIVDFVTRIGKDPFHKIILQPLNYKEEVLELSYVVNYFLSIKE